MKKWKNWRWITVLLIMSGCNALVPGLQVEKILSLDDFPSGSSLEYYRDRLYLSGDDATRLLILDTAYNRIDSVILFESELPRIPKGVKADLEASAVVTFDNNPNLLLIGSASLPTREKVILMPLYATAKTQVQTTGTYFKRLLNTGIREINIEGATAARNLLIMGNRGNLSHPYNHLVFTDTAFWLHQQTATIKSALIILPRTQTFTGISGLAYIEKNDLLLFTASTELTDNSFEDGEIGNSYIGWIKNISGQTGKRKIEADGFINLTQANNIFTKEKIESICVSRSERNTYTIHLVSDNDEGISTLFRAKLTID